MGKGEKGHVAQKVQDWSREKHHESIQQAIEAEAQKRGLRLATHVGMGLSFREYVTGLHPLLNGGEEFDWHPHCLTIARVLEEVLTGQRSRVMIWMPPRSGKSTLVQYFSSYYLASFPSRFVGLSSYNQDLADTLSKLGKRSYMAAGYPLSPDSKAVSYWQTMAGGGMWAAGTDGAQLGKGYSLGLIDDPTKSDQFVDSLSAMDRLYRWYSGTFATRQNVYAGVRAAIVLVQQRLGDYDLSGWLLSRPKPEPWHVVCCEAVKEESEIELPPGCTLEPDHRKPGEYLIPRELDGGVFADFVDGTRDNEPFVFHSLFQQRPTKASGQRVNADQFKYIEADLVPSLKYIVRAWDTQVSKTSRDWTVGVKLGLDHENNMYVLDVVRAKQDAVDIFELIVQTALSDGDDVAIAIEEVAISKQTVQELKKEGRLGTFEFKPIKVDSAKGNLEKRSAALFSRIRNGQVFLMEGAAWAPKFVDEFVRFSGSRNDTDDQVSACTVGMAATYSRRGLTDQQASRPAYLSPAWAELKRQEEMQYVQPSPW